MATIASAFAALWPLSLRGEAAFFLSEPIFPGIPIREPPPLGPCHFVGRERRGDEAGRRWSTR
jgi:hypothetical protein